MANNNKDIFGQPTSNIITGPNKLPYTAYGINNTGYAFRLQLRPKDTIWERFSYSVLFRILEDQNRGKTIALMFNYSMAVVVIQGRNLQPVADAIARSSCDFVQEFDPERWQLPADENAPVIESITVNLNPPDINGRPAEKVIEIALAKKNAPPSSV